MNQCVGSALIKVDLLQINEGGTAASPSFRIGWLFVFLTQGHLDEDTLKSVK